MTRRPGFAKRYPDDPRLDGLLQAFSRGDYARVRKQAAALAAGAEDQDVRDAARDLRRRVAPSPLAIYLLLLGAALVVFLYWHSLR